MNRLAVLQVKTAVACCLLAVEEAQAIRTEAAGQSGETRSKLEGPLRQERSFHCRAHAGSPGPLVLPSQRLCAKSLRTDNNPGLVEHTWRKTMRHWITSFRLLTTLACYDDSRILKGPFRRLALRSIPACG